VCNYRDEAQKVVERSTADSRLKRLRNSRRSIDGADEYVNSPALCPLAT
jgi:hypothetical protein